MDRRALEEAPTRELSALLLAPGERVGSTYTVTSMIGQGGMSQIFEAEDTGLRRRVAIKVNMADLTGEQLRREARALAAVRHPGLPIVYGLGEHQGTPFLAMERLYGVSLHHDLQRLRAAGGSFPLGEALDILICLADALAEVHRAGLAHCDVKPANLMMCPRGRVVLLDFGIFQAEVEVDNDEICGTPGYMAPEQIQRRIRPGRVHLVDTYAFGAVACELLIGRKPYDATNFVEVLHMQLVDDPPDLTVERPGAPSGLIQMVYACLAKSPESRPQSMEDIAAELRELARRLRSTVPAYPRVLIVDDDEDFAGFASDCLDQLLDGAQIRAVATCEEAMEVVRREPPTLLLVDIRMPGMGGVELCLRLKAMRLARRTEIVVVSGEVDEQSRRALEQAGVRHLLSKGPMLPSRLARITQRLTAARAKQIR